MQQTGKTSDEDTKWSHKELLRLLIPPDPGFTWQIVKAEDIHWRAPAGFVCLVTLLPMLSFVAWISGMKRHLGLSASVLCSLSLKEFPISKPSPSAKSRQLWGRSLLSFLYNLEYSDSYHYLLSLPQPRLLTQILGFEVRAPGFKLGLYYVTSHGDLGISLSLSEPVFSPLQWW